METGSISEQVVSGDSSPLVERRSFAVDALSVLGSNVLALAMSFGAGVVLARSLGPEGRGLLSALLVVPGLVVSISKMGVQQATVYSIGRSSSPQRAVSAVSLLLLMSCIVGVLLSIGAYSFIGTEAFTVAMLTIMCLVFLPSQLVSSYMSGVLLGVQRIRSFSSIRRLSELIRFIAVLLLVAVGGWGVTGALVATALASLVVAVYALYSVGTTHSLRPRFDGVIIRQILSVGWLYSLSLFLLQLNYRVDVILLKKLSTPSELGHYALGVGLVEQLWQVSAAMGVVLFSRSANSKTNDVPFVSRLLRISLFITFVGALLLGWCTWLIVPAIYGEAFRPSTRIILALLPGIVAFTAVKILNSDLAGRGHPKVALIVMFPMVILNVVLNIVLIPSFGGMGAAIASSATYAVAALAFCMVYGRLSSISMSDLLIPTRSDYQLIRSLPARVLGRIRGMSVVVDERSQP